MFNSINISKNKKIATDGGSFQNKYFMFICESCGLQMQLNNKELAKSRAVEHRNSGHTAYWIIERKDIW